MTENCYLITGHGGFGEVHLLFPAIQYRNKPLWYALWLTDCTCNQDVVDQIYNDNVFTKDGNPKDDQFFQVSVSGRLRFKMNFFNMFSPAFSHPESSFTFFIHKVTVPQPVRLPFQARFFLFVNTWLNIAFFVSAFLAFLFFISRLGS
jgi:hypothetical protein